MLNLKVSSFFFSLSFGSFFFWGFLYNFFSIFWGFFPRFFLYKLKLGAFFVEFYLNLFFLILANFEFIVFALYEGVKLKLGAPTPPLHSNTHQEQRYSDLQNQEFKFFFLGFLSSSRV